MLKLLLMFLPLALGSAGEPEILPLGAARGGFDGKAYELKDGVLSRLDARFLPFDEPDRIEVHARTPIEEGVVKMEVNGLYALSGSIFAYSVVYLTRRGELKALLGWTYQDDYLPMPDAHISITVAEGVRDFTPAERKGMDFGARYDITWEKGAEPGDGFDIDAALRAKTAELSDGLDAYKAKQAGK